MQPVKEGKTANKGGSRRGEKVVDVSVFGLIGYNL